MPVVARNLAPFEIDVSDEACSKFGFRHGERIFDNDAQGGGVVAGVAREYEWLDSTGEEVLWYALDKDHGLVSYNSAQNYREEEE